MKHPTLVVICGWPFSGKSTLARHITFKLGIHHVDIDKLRWLAIGRPLPNPDKSSKFSEIDRQEMAMSYRLLLAGVHENLTAGRSLIITATFSRKVGQQMLQDLMAKHPDAQLSIIQCIPTNDTDEEVASRMASRDFGQGAYMGTVNSVKRYKEVKERYDRIELPHLEIRTWGSAYDGKIEREVAEAVGYITG